MAQRTVENLQRRAAFQPSTFNREARTIELTWSTGAAIKRSSWFDGDFIEELSLADGHVRLERLNMGASLLNNHQSRELSNVIGVVERAWVEAGQGRAVVRFSERDDVAPIMADVADGIIRNVSVGYLVHGWEQYGAPEGGLKTFRAVDWEPYEISLVGVPADMGAQVRGHAINDQPPPMTQQLAGGDPATEPTTLERAAVAESVTPTIPPSPEPVPAASVSSESQELARTVADLKRERDILRSCQAAKLSSEQAQAYVDSGKSHEEIVRSIFEVMADNTPAKSAGHPARVEVTRDSGDTLMRGIGEYLLWRTRSHEKPSEHAREFRGMSLRELGRAYLESRGVNTRGMGIDELVTRAFHSTGDFPLLFSDVANKNLLAGYEEEPQTWRPLARQQNLPDFKLSRDLQIQGRIVPQVLPENGEYQLATMREAQATWNLVTYAVKVLINRQAIINDDLSALERGPEVLGRGFRLHESDLVWALLTGGTEGALAGIDGVALFNAAHNNTGTGVINLANVTAGDLAIGLQKDIVGNELNLEPAFLIVPRGLKVLAMQFVDTTNHQPTTKTGNDAVNPFAGNLQVISETRLQTRSATQWYLAASPNRIEMIKFGYLQGQEGPTITPMETRDPDGVSLLARYDFGCTVSDFRGFYRSTGA